MVLSLSATLIVYLATILIFKSILDVAFILNDLVWLKIIAITIASWMPFYLFFLFKKSLFPNTTEKLSGLDVRRRNLAKMSGLDRSRSHTLLV